MLDGAAKALTKISNLRDLVAGFSNNFEDIVLRANNLEAPKKAAFKIWSREREELKIIPLRLKTLEVLNTKSKALFEEIKTFPLSKAELENPKQQAESIESRYTEIKELSQRLMELSQKIHEGLVTFDTNVESFKQLGLQIITPFQSGLQNSLEDQVRTAEAQLAEATLKKEFARRYH